VNSLRQRLREVIVLMADLPDSALDVPDAFHVSLSYRMTAWETLGGDAPATPIAAAKMIRRQYEELEEKTRKATVDAVLWAQAQGLGMRDIADIMGISHQRVSQIASEAE